MKLASLKDYSQKDLALMAKQTGVPGWHDMRKDQLVRVLARRAVLASQARAKRDKAKLARRPAAGKAFSNGQKPVAPKAVVKTAALAKTVALAKTEIGRAHV